MARGRKLDKLKRNFYRAVEELRRLEKGLEKDSRKEDLTYSRNHQLEPHPPEERSGPEESGDFYVLESQKESDCKGDTEESSGTMDDYLSYKGGLRR